MLAPQAAQARGGHTVCLVEGKLAAHLDGAMAGAQRPECEYSAIDLDAPRTIVRIEASQHDMPQFVISRTAKFSAISVGVAVGDQILWSHHDFEDVEAIFFDRQFVVPLPRYEGRPRAIYVAVDGATQATTFDHLRVAEEIPGSSKADMAVLMIVSLFVGLMLMPILFDLVFYRVLRETFILWHAALVTSLAVQLVCSYGLYTAFVDVRLPVVRLITVGSFSMMVFAAIMFSLRFIERGKLPDRLRKTVLGLTIAFAAISCVHLAGIEALGRWPSIVYFFSGAPLALSVITMLIVALRNGSRTARYLVIGLSPLIAVALTRVISFMLPGVATIDANELLIAATLIEVTATALGVASRFLALKLDRDRAHAEMDLLGGMAQQDALTGLLNRRFIDTRYRELRAQGFDTLALIDLDRFKDINDRFGHQIGDAVLVASADAIRGDPKRDLIAVRLGGEEFVLLLRGKDAIDRAEALRQAIPRRIATDVPQLDRLVTASMGVIELPRDAIEMMDFEELYARADILLYEAKASGRNRMLYERLKLFDTTPPAREAQQAKALA